MLHGKLEKFIIMQQHEIIPYSRKFLWGPIFCQMVSDMRDHYTVITMLILENHKLGSLNFLLYSNNNVDIYLLP